MAIMNPNDLVGSKFGKLTVKSYVGRVPTCSTGLLKHMYICDCDCGAQDIMVNRDLLRSGGKKSCGCAHQDAGDAVIENMVGRTYGRWTVIKRAPNRISKSGKTHSVMWTCRCECGKVKDVGARALKTGMSVSCGCYQKERVSEALTDDLLGQRFGYLTVVSRNGSTSSNSKSGKAAIWHCVCDCGRELDVPSWMLKNGDYSSCGCKKISKYELYVMQYLESLGYVRDVDYIKEKMFPGLVGIGNVSLRFDFFVHLHSGRDVLIECQGEQHYRAVDWFGGEENFRKQQARDAIKRDFAKQSGLLLIEVPYTAVLYSDVEQCLKGNGVN